MGQNMKLQKLGEIKIIIFNSKNRKHEIFFKIIGHTKLTHGYSTYKFEPPLKWQ